MWPNPPIHWLTAEKDWNLDYPLDSCQIEWISSEMDHVAHVIRFHPEKVFEDEVQRIIHEALQKMVRITKSKEKKRLQKFLKKQVRKGAELTL